MRVTTLFIAPIVLALVMTACEQDTSEQVSFEMDHLSIADFLEKNCGQYSKFYNIASQGDMMIPLSAYNPNGDGYTLFLPTDEAVERYVERSDKYGSYEELLQDSSFVRTLGRYHVVNRRFHSSEFPYGPLPENTATGDLLVIGFSTNLDSMVCRINNIAPLIEPDHFTVNGYIHVISELLEPVRYSGFEWLRQNPDYSILSDALEVTGLMSKFGVNSKYTILAEHDSVFHNYGIHSVDDLEMRFDSPGIPPTSWNSSLYQFAAYHVLKGRYFLSDFRWGTRKYSTYSHAPVTMSRGIDFKINPGTDTLAIKISESGDTTFINYIQLLYENSNILAKRQVIHLISDVLFIP